jgi:hypothetical protein
MRTKSKARVMNAANIHANGTNPTTCMPTAGRGDHLLLGDVHLEEPIGRGLLKSSACVGLLISPSSTTMSSRVRKGTEE